MPRFAREDMPRRFEEKEPPAVYLARQLGRKIGRGGGLRDLMSDGALRDRYIQVAVARTVKDDIRLSAESRGMAISAYLGAVIEAVEKSFSQDEIDDLLAGED